MTRGHRITLALSLTLLLGLSVGCFKPKQPDVYLPKWEPLPVVTFYTGHNGDVCLTAEQADALVKREQVRAVRENTLKEMLKALGAKEAP